MGINKKHFSVFIFMIFLSITDIYASDKVPTIKEYIENSESYDSYIYGLDLIVARVTYIHSSLPHLPSSAAEGASASTEFTVAVRYGSDTPSDIQGCQG